MQLTSKTNFLKGFRKLNEDDVRYMEELNITFTIREKKTRTELFLEI